MEMKQWIFWMILGSAVGAGLGYALNRIYRKKWIPLVVMIACMVLAPNIAAPFSASNNYEESPLTFPAQPKTEDEAAELTITVMEDQHSYLKLLFEVEPRFRSEVHAMLKSTNDVGDTGALAQAYGLIFAESLKYLPYADDEAVAAYANRTIDLVSYAEEHGESSCEAVINASSSNFHLLPSDMLSDQSAAKDNMFSSGISGFKNGNHGKLTFTPEELFSYLAGIKESSETFKEADIKKVLDGKASSQEQCRAISSLSGFVKKERTQNVAKFWRTLELGTRD